MTLVFQPPYGTNLKGKLFPLYFLENGMYRSFPSKNSFSDSFYGFRVVYFYFESHFYAIKIIIILIKIEKLTSLDQESSETRVDKPVLKERHKNGQNGRKTPRKRINQLNLNAVDSASEGKLLYGNY